MLKFGLVDEVIPEPLGGAHWDYDQAAEMLKNFLLPTIEALEKIPAQERVNNRIEKFGKLAKQIEREMLAELDEKEGAKVSEECATIVQAFEKKYYAGAGVTQEKDELSAEELALLQKFGVKI